MTLSVLLMSQVATPPLACHHCCGQRGARGRARGGETCEELVEPWCHPSTAPKIGSGSARTSEGAVGSAGLPVYSDADVSCEAIVSLARVMSDAPAQHTTVPTHGPHTLASCASRWPRECDARVLAENSVRRQMHHLAQGHALGGKAGVARHEPPTPTRTSSQSSLQSLRREGYPKADTPRARCRCGDGSVGTRKAERSRKRVNSSMRRPTLRHHAAGQSQDSCA
mmetsp:Transcript_16158/g.43503  ORF Transcript_16158/g.43503 Transcript_16158/m.43503 type:complete len:225 (+) Transcript_16158:471-1145(+)